MPPCNKGVNLLGEVESFLKSIEYLERPYVNRDGQIRCIPSGHLLIKRSTLYFLNGFDEKFTIAAGEDNNLTVRAITLGFIVSYSYSLYVFHKHPSSILGMGKKFYEYGYGNFLNCKALNLDLEDNDIVEITNILDFLIYFYSVLKKAFIHVSSIRKLSCRSRLLWFLYFLVMSFAFQLGAIWTKNFNNKLVDPTHS